MEKFLRSAEALKNVLPQGKTFTLVGGVFDMFHVGHLHLLQFAATLEDLLVIAVLSDSYVRSYKNQLRPVINENQRAAVLASVRFVDHVYISEVSPNSSEVVALLKPDSVVFGREVGRESRLEKRIARVKDASPNTKVQLLPRFDEEEVSTSSIIAKILRG